MASAWEVWKAVQKALAIPKINYYTSLWKTNALSQSLYDRLGRIWEQQGLRKIGDIYEGDQMLGFTAIKQKLGLPANQGFKFIQIQKSLLGLRPRISPGGRINLVEYLVGGGLVK